VQHLTFTINRLQSARRLILIVIAWAAFAMPSIERQLDRWGLLPRQEQLTELSITRTQDLPKTYTPDGNHQIAFTLHNLEGHTTTYEYAVTFRTADGKTVSTLDRGVLTLKKDETKAVWLQTQLPDAGKHAYIHVTLSNSQSIGYWLERE
jgi:hypothetical protein